MADTQTLLALINEFPEPFLDPESTPAPISEQETGLTGGFKKYSGCETFEDGQRVDLLMEDGTIYVGAHYYFHEAVSGDPCTRTHSFIHDDSPDKDGDVNIHEIKAWKLPAVDEPDLTFAGDDTEEELDWFEQCSTDLLALQDEPELQKMAVKFLGSLSELARRYEHCNNASVLQAVLPHPEKGTQQPLPSVWDDTLPEFELPNLPETYARKGSGDCPSGMCPIDH